MEEKELKAILSSYPLIYGKINEHGFIFRPRIYCKDGVSLSVQAGKTMYCTPRDSFGPWSEVEVGFIEDEDGNKVEVPESWDRYSDGENIWAYIPIEMVMYFIMSHGGIDHRRTRKEQT